MSVTSLPLPATPATPPSDFKAHAELLVRVFGYRASDVPALCPLATPETQAALALAMAAVTDAGNVKILEAARR